MAYSSEQLRHFLTEVQTTFDGLVNDAPAICPALLESFTETQSELIRVIADVLRDLNRGLEPDEQESLSYLVRQIRSFLKGNVADFRRTNEEAKLEAVKDFIEALSHGFLAVDLSDDSSLPISGDDFPFSLN